MKRFALHTLGCKVNQFESECLAERFRERGWSAVSFGEPAEAAVVNTCAVTAEAQRQSAQAVRSILRRHPRTRVMAVGCAVQVYPDYFKKIIGLDGLSGTGHKTAAVSRWAFGENTGQADPSPRPGLLSLECPLPSRRSRALFRIQEGCDSNCSYCLVPQARGRSRSLHPEDVREGLRRLARQGVPEVVLTGIHLGQYGRDLQPALVLASLLEDLPSETPLPRLRLSSLEMEEITPRLIELVRQDHRFCPHFHIPLQSGDDRLLAAMNRHYSTEAYAALIHRLRAAIPLAAVGADVIVGFPGEDEASFQRTERFLSRLPLSYLHVFPYSPRPGTPAAGFPDPVPATIKKERSRRLRSLDQVLRQRFMRGNVGSVRTAVVLGDGKNQEGRGLVLTDNYLNVQIQGSLQVSTPVRIRIIGSRGAELMGEPVT